MRIWLFFFLVPPLFSLPKGERLVVGEAFVCSSEQGLVIHQKGSKAILEWEAFSLREGEHLLFQMPSADASILNRVVGAEISHLNGRLESNGRVFLVNPNGIAIGPKGLFQTKGFVAAALNLTNESFLSGGEYFFSGGMGRVDHQGVIEVLEGDILLIGRECLNAGKLLAENVSLAAGEEVLLLEQKGKIVRVRGEGSLSHTGFIEAVKAELKAEAYDIGTLAINLDGGIQAEQEVYIEGKGGEVVLRGDITARGGVVHLLGEYVQLLDEATIDVSHPYGGGVVLCGGDYQGQNPEIPNAKMVFVGPDVQVNASATECGNGGKLIFWGDRLNHFFGKVAAEGGPYGGDGGLIEVSSHGSYICDRIGSTAAPRGRVGTFLLDPVTLTITSTAGSNSGITVGQLPVPPPAQPDPFSVTFTGNTATITTTTLANALAVNNIIIDCTTSGSGTGNVTFSGSGTDLTWAAATKLKIIAAPSASTTAAILVSRPITNTLNNGGVAFDCIDFQANTSQSAPGLSFCGIQVAAAGRIVTVDGNISLNGTAGDTGVSSLTSTGVQIERRATNGETSLECTGAGAITLTGTSSQPTTSTTAFQRGVMINSSVLKTVNGNLTLTGTARDGVGASSSTTQAVLVNGGANANLQTSGTGNILITGTANATLTGSGRTGVHVGNGSVATIQCTGSGSITITGSTLATDATATAFARAVLLSGLSASSRSSVSTSGVGNVTITGSCADSLASFGVQTGHGTITTTGSGSITITGSTATGGSGIGIAFNASQAPSTGVVTSVANTILEATTVDVTSTGTLTLSSTGSGTMTYESLSPTTAISIGTSIANTANFPATIFLSNASSPTTTISGFSQIIVGRSNQNSTTTMAATTLGFPLLIRNDTVTISSSNSMSANNLDVTIGLTSGTGLFNLNSNFSTASGTNTIGGTGAASNNTFSAATGAANAWSITGTQSGFLVSGGITYAFRNMGVLSGGSAVDTFTFQGSGVVTSVNGGGGNNSIQGPNLPNLWSVTGRDQGTFTTTNGIVAFSNVGTLIGGNQADTFQFTNQISLTGQVDGGAPAAPNSLVYTSWSPPPTIEIISSTTGNSSNLNLNSLYSLGYINIGHILFPKGRTIDSILSFQTQMDLALSPRLTLPYDLMGLPWSFGLWSRCVLYESIDCAKEFEPIQW